MEIAKIDKVQTVGKVAQKEGVQAARVEDSLTISSESKKKAEWVEMLKAMPDIRPDKIESTLANAPISKNIIAAIAQKIANSEL